MKSPIGCVKYRSELPNTNGRGVSINLAGNPQSVPTIQVNIKMPPQVIQCGECRIHEAKEFKQKVRAYPDWEYALAFRIFRKSFKKLSA